MTQPQDGRSPAAEGTGDRFPSSKVAEVLPTSKQGRSEKKDSKEPKTAAPGDPVTQRKLSSLPTNTTDAIQAKGDTGKATNYCAIES